MAIFSIALPIVINIVLKLKKKVVVCVPFSWEIHLNLEWLSWTSWHYLPVSLMQGFSLIWEVPSKSLKSYAAATIYLLGKFWCNKVVICSLKTMSSIIWWISDIPDRSIFLSYISPSSLFRTPASAWHHGTLKSSAFSSECPISYPSLHRASMVMFHLLGKKLNVTLWCLLALKFPNHGTGGNFSVSIRLLLTPVLCANRPFWWLHASVLTPILL